MGGVSDGVGDGDPSSISESFFSVFAALSLLPFGKQLTITHRPIVAPKHLNQFTGNPFLLEAMLFLFW